MRILPTYLGSFFDLTLNDRQWHFVKGVSPRVARLDGEDQDRGCFHNKDSNGRCQNGRHVLSFLSYYTSCDSARINPQCG
jgi:hypothetical protein